MAKKEKKDKKEFSKAEKLLYIAILVAAITCLVLGSFYYGLFIGSVTGYHNAVGTQGICDKLNKTMEGERCVISDVGAYKHLINCVWGEFIVYDDDSAKKVKLDPRLVIMRCKVVEDDI